MGLLSSDDRQELIILLMQFYDINNEQFRRSLFSSLPDDVRNNLPYDPNARTHLGLVVAKLESSEGKRKDGSHLVFLLIGEAVGNVDSGAELHDKLRNFEKRMKAKADSVHTSLIVDTDNDARGQQGRDKVTPEPQPIRKPPKPPEVTPELEQKPDLDALARTLDKLTKEVKGPGQNAQSSPVPVEESIRNVESGPTPVDEVPDTLSPEKFRERLSMHFDMSELVSLCFDLNVKWEDLAGETITRKVIELIRHMERRGRKHELIEKCQKLRPRVNWTEPALRCGALLLGVSIEWEQERGYPDAPEVVEEIKKKLIQYKFVLDKDITVLVGKEVTSSTIQQWFDSCGERFTSLLICISGRTIVEHTKVRIYERESYLDFRKLVDRMRSLEQHDTGACIILDLELLTSGIDEAISHLKNTLIIRWKGPPGRRRMDNRITPLLDRLSKEARQKLITTENIATALEHEQDLHYSKPETPRRIFMRTNEASK